MLWSIPPKRRRQSPQALLVWILKKEDCEWAMGRVYDNPFFHSWLGSIWESLGWSLKLYRIRTGFDTDFKVESKELRDKVRRVTQSFSHNLGFSRLLLPFGYLVYPHETVPNPCSFAENINGKDKKFEDNSAKEDFFSAGYLPFLGSLEISIEIYQPSNASYGMLGESATPLAALLEALGTHLADSFQTSSFSSNRKREARATQNEFVTCSLTKRKESLEADNKGIIQIGPGNWEDVEAMEQGTDPFGMKIDSIPIPKVINDYQYDTELCQAIDCSNSTSNKAERVKLADDMYKDHPRTI
ncbi:hypothetical protein V6N11_006878 [Hibiscus sabdariffa]|uniref:Uncharacterized protein n=1 Tax=Hibiscus sabdariffa TaxID=183260 RepID=A0ABR2RSN7_9ROSI